MRGTRNICCSQTYLTPEGYLPFERIDTRM